MCPDPDQDAPAPEPGPELPDELRAQLRSAAETLAELIGGDLERAEQAMFESARELTRNATVFQYAPVLASRRARRLLRQADEQG